MLIRYPPHSKGQWKNLVLASDSSNQQTLVLKKKISRICENKISVESVQMILKLDIWNICLDQIHKIIHTWKLYIKVYIRKIV